MSDKSGRFNKSNEMIYRMKSNKTYKSQKMCEAEIIIYHLYLMTVVYYNRNNKVRSTR